MKPGMTTESTIQLAVLSEISKRFIPKSPKSMAVTANKGWEESGSNGSSCSPGAPAFWVELKGELKATPAHVFFLGRGVWEEGK